MAGSEHGASGRPRADRSQWLRTSFSPRATTEQQSGNGSAVNEGANHMPAANNGRAQPFNQPYRGRGGGGGRGGRQQNRGTASTPGSRGPQNNAYRQQYDQTGARPRTWNRGGRGGRNPGNYHGRREDNDHTFLKNMRDQDPQGIAVNMASRKNLENIINLNKLEQRDQILLIEVLSKACQCNNPSASFNNLLSFLVDPNMQFLQQMPLFLMNLSNFGRIPNSIISNVLLNTINILSSILKHTPSTCYLAVCVVVTILERNISDFQSKKENARYTSDDNNDLLVSSLQNLQELLEIVKQEMEAIKGNTNFGKEKKEPPNDFRQMSVFPTKEDFDPNFPHFVRENIVEGFYDDGNHYLDVQFRLLREDFIRPLRSGISEYKKEKAKGQLGRLRLTDINIYNQVTYYSNVYNHSGVCYKIQFDNERFQHVRWESNKRLIYGSLVCLTKDEFTNHFVFATIAERDVEELKKGLINIAIESEFEQLEANTVYLMAESGAYFESYRHVLKGLQEMKGEEVPFQEHVVEAKTEVKPPEYLNGASVYNFSCIQNRKDMKHTSVPVLKDNEWPSAGDLSLDESQFKALKRALTKKLAIIQGPPGTGKTYIGLKIVKILLENSRIWQYNNIMHAIDNKPILIVCYTNHALDQFLEGILEEYGGHFEGLVRIGSRSKCESLENYNMKDLRRKVSLGPNMFAQRGRARDQMKQIQNGVINSEAIIEATNSNILKKEILQEYMLGLHSEQLDAGLRELNNLRYRENRKKEADILLIWLGIKWSEYMQNMNDDEEMPLEDIREGVEGINIPIADDKDDDEEEFSDNEEDEDEEANFLTNQRVIQIENFLSNRDEYKKRKNEQIKKLTHDIEDTTENPEKPDDDGWTLVGKKKKFDKKYMEKELNKVDIMTRDEANAVEDVWDLSPRNRWRLYRFWTTQLRIEEARKIEEQKQEYANAADQVQEINDEFDMAVLNKAVIIGMTTSGAAKYRRNIQRVCPKIVIVEEAAEVFEAHVVTSLSNSCQHLILIGDHQQLRPNPTDYQLAKKFHLDISLFERMLKNGIQISQLEQQHRMRPEIAELMRPIYPTLKNHHSVLTYDNIKGVSKNVFFLDHEKKERSIDDMKSHANVFEAEFAAALCHYLLKQDYNPSQITILTTYSGQFLELKKLMPKNSIYNGIRISIVDNFQGEENDIIILSLVRSNDTDSIGFLSISNRVCVALSRAKKGFFCIGNMQMLAGKSGLWLSMVDQMKERQQIGPALELTCQNHSKNIIQARKSADFRRAPEGGCLSPCEFRLDCGHVCSRVCHPYDPMHKQYKCPKQISVDLPCGHLVNTPCYKQSDVSKIKCLQRCEEILACGHQCVNKCGDEKTHSIHLPNHRCNAPCEKWLPCGHKCTKICGQPCTSPCLARVDSDWPCGHVMKIKCYQKGDYRLCNVKCNATLSCEHACSGTCGACHMSRLHVLCHKICNRSLVCGHLCGDHPCGNSCPPCKKPCENQCEHSKCKKECGLPCTPCQELCQNRCEHGKCNNKCGDVCDKPLCDQPCWTPLRCGLLHKCIGICGDVCPQKCRICDREELDDGLFGTEDVDEGLFIQLVDCGHVFDVDGLDHWMNMASEPEEGAINIQMKACPRCKTPIRRSRRYRDIVNKILNDIEEVKSKVFGSRNTIQAKRVELKRKVPDLDLDYNHHNSFLTRKQQKYLDGSEIVSYEEMVFLENKIEMFSKLLRLGLGKYPVSGGFTSSRSLPDVCTCGRCNVCDMREIFENSLKEIKQYLSPLDIASNQQMEDILAEMNRISLVNQLVEMLKKVKGIYNQSKKNDILAGLKFAQNILSTGKPLTKENKTTIKKIFEEIRKSGISGLDLTEEERVMIVNAVGLTKGHWYKCPNGHVYAIGECGGANQESTCPECNAKIGGRSHALAAGNQHAGEMDGSSYASWSETANEMFNYEEFR